MKATRRTAGEFPGRDVRIKRLVQCLCIAALGAVILLIRFNPRAEPAAGLATKSPAQSVALVAARSEPIQRDAPAAPAQAVDDAVFVLLDEILKMEAGKRRAFALAAFRELTDARRAEMLAVLKAMGNSYLRTELIAVLHQAWAEVDPHSALASALGSDREVLRGVAKGWARLDGDAAWAAIGGAIPVATSERFLFYSDIADGLVEVDKDAKALELIATAPPELMVPFMRHVGAALLRVNPSAAAAWLKQTEATDIHSATMAAMSMGTGLAGKDPAVIRAFLLGQSEKLQTNIASGLALGWGSNPERLRAFLEAAPDLPDAVYDSIRSTMVRTAELKERMSAK